MEIILKEDVRSLGQVGEIVRVKEGYARNYLLPRKLAVIATPTSRKQLEKEQQSIEARRAEKKREAEAVAEKLQALPVVIEREVGEEEKIFGSVTTKQISEAIAVRGMTIDHRWIQVSEPIRHLGTFTVGVHLHPEVIAQLTVEVRKK